MSILPHRSFKRSRMHGQIVPSIPEMDLCPVHAGMLENVEQELPDGVEDQHLSILGEPPRLPLASPSEHQRNLSAHVDVG